MCLLSCTVTTRTCMESSEVGEEGRMGRRGEWGGGEGLWGEGRSREIWKSEEREEGRSKIVLLTTVWDWLGLLRRTG